MPFTSTPCKLMRRSPGGVGRNLATAIAALEVLDVTFFTAVGEDALREQRLRGLIQVQGAQFRQEPLILPGKATATYTAILGGDGDLAAAAADMSLLDNLSPEVFLDSADFRAAVKSANVLVLEGNLPQQVIEAITSWCHSSTFVEERRHIHPKVYHSVQGGNENRNVVSPVSGEIKIPSRRLRAEDLPPIKIYFDPVSPQKALRGVSSLHRFYAVKPNEFEVHQMLNQFAVGGGLDLESSSTTKENKKEPHRANDAVENAARRLCCESGCPLILATRGPEGVSLAWGTQQQTGATTTADAARCGGGGDVGTMAVTLPALQVDPKKMIKVTGAGDTFLASFISFIEQFELLASASRHHQPPPTVQTLLQSGSQYLGGGGSGQKAEGKLNAALLLLKTAATFSMIGSRAALYSMEPIPVVPLRRLVPSVFAGVPLLPGPSTRAEGTQNRNRDGLNEWVEALAAAVAAEAEADDSRVVSTNVSKL